MNPEIVKMYLSGRVICSNKTEKEDILNKMEKVLSGRTSTEDKVEKILKLSEQLKSV